MKPDATAFMIVCDGYAITALLACKKRQISIAKRMRLAGLEVAYETGIFQNTRGLWVSGILIMVIAVYISTKNLKVGSHF